MTQILSNLKQLIYQALVSAKTWTFLIGLTATWMAKKNIVLPPELAMEIAAGFAALLAGQIVTTHVLTTQQARATSAERLEGLQHTHNLENLKAASDVHLQQLNDLDLKKSQAGFIKAPLLVAFALAGTLGMVIMAGLTTAPGCASTSALGTCEVSVLDKQLPNSSGTIVTDIIDAVASGGSALPALLATIDSVYPGTLACLGAFVDDLISKYLTVTPASGSAAGSASVAKLGVLNVDAVKTKQGLTVFHDELRKRHLPVNTTAAPLTRAVW